MIQIHNLLTFKFLIQKTHAHKTLDSIGPPLSNKQVRSITILREIPFVVPFNTRVGIFQGLVAADRLRFVLGNHSRINKITKNLSRFFGFTQSSR